MLRLGALILLILPVWLFGPLHPEPSGSYLYSLILLQRNEPEPMPCTVPRASLVNAPVRNNWIEVDGWAELRLRHPSLDPRTLLSLAPPDDRHGIIISSIVDIPDSAVVEIRLHRSVCGELSGDVYYEPPASSRKKAGHQWWNPWNREWATGKFLWSEIKDQRTSARTSGFVILSN